MAINLVTKVEPKVMERLYKESVTQGLFSNQYTFQGVRGITVMSVDTVELSKYDRTDTPIGQRFGEITELGDTKVDYEMQDEVKYNIGFDKANNSDQYNIKTASSIISRQDREIVVPYRDTYRLRKLAEGAGLKKYGVSDGIKRDKFLETLFNARAELANNYAPMNKQVLYIGETKAIELKLANEVIGNDKVAEKPIVNGTIGKVAGFQLRIVPDVYLPNNLAFLIVTKGSAWAPVKVKTSRVITDPEGFDGTLVQYHEYHDCFVNKAREKTIYSAWTTSE